MVLLNECFPFIFWTKHKFLQLFLNWLFSIVAQGKVKKKKTIRMCVHSISLAWWNGEQKTKRATGGHLSLCHPQGTLLSASWIHSMSTHWRFSSCYLVVDIVYPQHLLAGPATPVFALSLPANSQPSTRHRAARAPERVSLWQSPLWWKTCPSVCFLSASFFLAFSKSASF